MSDFIHVQPDAVQRAGFARWAVAQKPKIRTVAPTVFAVPPALFAAVPEPLLIGAVVDGHRYVSPDEDQSTGLLGVATAEGLAAIAPELEGIPGEPLPDVPEEAYGPDSAPLDKGSQSDQSDSNPEVADETAPFACGICVRDFTSTRGRDTHRRQVHPED